MRLIDADALVSKCGNWYCEEGTEEGFIGDIKHLMDAQPTITPERKRGRWLEKKVVHAINDGCIDEWQSCKCSECGRYNTRPYMYYFDEPNFCSWCGAEMQEDES